MPKYTFTVTVDNELSEQDLESLAFMWRDGIEEWTKKGLVPAKNFEVQSWETASEDA
jgi:hypothetical protein